MYALTNTSFTLIHCGNYAAASAQVDEVIALADEKGALHRQAGGMSLRGWLFALTGKAGEAVHMITSGTTAWRSTGSTFYMPMQLSFGPSVCGPRPIR
jgi:hypothetical protein